MRVSRPDSARPRRKYFRTIAGRRLIRQAAVVAGAFGAGYLATVFWLFPAPLLPKQAPVPRVLDIGITEAKEIIQAQGFRVTVQDQQTDPTVPRGGVIWQDPPAGVLAPPNTQVTLVLSEGPPDVVIPDVAGFPRALTEKVLRAAGLKVGTTDTIPAPSEPGIVVQTRPGPGVGRLAGTAIDLVVSSGPVELTVPAVAGLPLAEARSRIETIGLAVGATRQRAVAGATPGLVIEQRPSAGTRMPRGSRVDLVISQKEP